MDINKERSKRLTFSENCALCNEDNINIYGVGKCDHPICYKCSVRMRVFAEQSYCAICRTDLSKVVYLDEIENFADIDVKDSLYDAQYQVYFKNNAIREAFYKLLENRCTICPDELFSSFTKLSDHARRQHQRFYCDLCVNNLIMFPTERQLYDRSELATHRRVGDKDNRSHKGHPLCEFCDQRYLDHDELQKHLRKDHFFCHFCDADGQQVYYSCYGLLRDHFAKNHFLCEDGECRDLQFTNSFRHEVDLKAHKHATHKGTRGQSKQMLALDVNISLPPRLNDRRRNKGRENYQQEGESNRRRYNPSRQNDEELDNAIAASLVNQSKTNVNTISVPKSNTYVAEPPPVDNSENFPTLSGNQPATSTTCSVESVPQNRLADRLAYSAGKSVGSRSLDDFPSLSKNDDGNRDDSTLRSLQQNWVSQNNNGKLANQHAASNSKSENDYPALPSNGGKKFVALQSKPATKALQPMQAERVFRPPKFKKEVQNKPSVDNSFSAKFEYFGPKISSSNNVQSGSSSLTNSFGDHDYPPIMTSQTYSKHAKYENTHSLSHPSMENDYPALHTNEPASKLSVINHSTAKLTKATDSLSSRTATRTDDFTIMDDFPALPAAPPKPSEKFMKKDTKPLNRSIAWKNNQVDQKTKKPEEKVPTLNTIGQLLNTSNVTASKSKTPVDATHDKTKSKRAKKKKVPTATLR